ncbi:MAG: tocopherol cyclase family protein [Atopostipes suicloacalis]|nr:tocopherol cyclase family protein [Atopostipes suicloacalis]MDN6730612.1 tocopherol cyclase family protein [Atopostipes suicloacalis]
MRGGITNKSLSTKKTSISFIPGISLNKVDSHSFIQYILIEDDQKLKEKTTHTAYVRFDLDDFSVQKNPFRVQIGHSIFTEDFIQIDFSDKSYHFKGNIQLGEFLEIERSLYSPNIMGPFAYIPKMQCYHGVISMQHDLKGSLKINNQRIDFTEGLGYIEKDWGNSFPKKYIWLHSNHFSEPSTSLFFSIAHIPFYITEFEGFIVNLVYREKEYRFASYNQSKCEIKEINENAVLIQLENKRASLKIKAEIKNQGQLIAPIKDGHMLKTIKEGISGKICINLLDKENGQYYEDVGENAGVEIVDYS